MKKKLLTLIAVLLLFVTVICISACSSSIYDEKRRDGYTVGVRFDPNGGRLKGRENISVIELFNPENAADGGIKILDPDDERREDGILKADKNNCFLAGWYTERNEIVDASGNVSYTYSGKWNFETDRIEIDPNREYDPEEPVMTLYAAWIPYFEYEIYAKNEVGVFDKVASTNLINLTIPAWNQETGRMDYQNFPTLSGKTFEAAYTDSQMTQKLEGTIDAMTDYVDYEKGIAKTNTIKLYTEWMDGEWFRIHTAKQFIDNTQLNGNYLICADLDFEGLIWDARLSVRTFAGKICAEEGKSCKFSNISVEQRVEDGLTRGLFGLLGDSAVIENVSFENVTYVINTSPKYNSKNQDLNFGLFAGQVSQGAALIGTGITGTIKITGTPDLSVNNVVNKYSIGKLFGMGSVEGLDDSGITCVIEEGTSLAFVEEDGKIILSIIQEQE